MDQVSIDSAFLDLTAKAVCCAVLSFNLAKLLSVLEFGDFSQTLQDFASQVRLPVQHCFPLHQRLFNLKTTMCALEADMILRKNAKHGGHNY